MIGAAFPVITLVGLINMMFGVSLGWYLRRANAWCPNCGDVLTCRGCNR